ncbi:DUF805 domain-containing protein [Albidovulum sp.]|uniref:DUF805 domain-containing protein n=1 Tax=Albidovulum sp. TaxID=1872424 RepID=UPI003D7DBF96
MSTVRSISACLRKSFTFDGRSSRSEFWSFAPVGFALPLLAAWLAPPSIDGLGSLTIKVLTVAIASIPLLAAAARRTQDTGLPSGDLWLGLKPTFIVLLSGWLAYFSFFKGHPLGATLRIPLVGVPSFLVLSVYVFLAPGTLGSTLGQLLLPSQPGPNKYGPNPIEVTP